MDWLPIGIALLVGIGIGVGLVLWWGRKPVEISETTATIRRIQAEARGAYSYHLVGKDGREYTVSLAFSLPKKYADGQWIIYAEDDGHIVTMIPKLD